MIIKYQKIIEKFSDGSSTTHDLNEPDYQDSDSRCTELATIDGVTYVHVPDDVTLPDQPAQINVEEVTLTPELREEIKAASPHVRLSYKRLNDRIRVRYSIDDELYLARIAIGAQLGTYEMQDDEPALLAEYQQYVEAQREVARQERAGWGL
jgi:hypothetical protein